MPPAWGRGGKVSRAWSQRGGVLLPSHPSLPSCRGLPAASRQRWHGGAGTPAALSFLLVTCGGCSRGGARSAVGNAVLECFWGWSCHWVGEETRCYLLTAAGSRSRCVKGKNRVKTWCSISALVFYLGTFPFAHRTDVVVRAP